MKGSLEAGSSLERQGESKEHRLLKGQDQRPGNFAYLSARGKGK